MDDLPLNPGLYSEGDVAILRELTYVVDKRGNVKQSPKFISTEANLLFTIKAWCRGICEIIVALSELIHELESHVWTTPEADQIFSRTRP